MVEANMGILHPGYWETLIQHGSLAPTLRGGFNCTGTHLGQRLVLKHSSGEAKVQSGLKPTIVLEGTLKRCLPGFAAMRLHWVSHPPPPGHCCTDSMQAHCLASSSCGSPVFSVTTYLHDFCKKRSLKKYHWSQECSWKDPKCLQGSVSIKEPPWELRRAWRCGGQLFLP